MSKPSPSGSLILAAAAALVFLAAASLPAAAKAPPAKAAQLQRFDTQGPVWSLAALSSGLALGELPQKLVVVSGGGQRLKEFDAGGLPLALAAGRLTPKGPEVIVVAAQDSAGHLYCLANEPEGLRQLWKYAGASPFLSVALGDIDGDGRAEVAAGSYAGRLCVLDGAGKLKWEAKTDEEGSVGAVAVGDLTGDGQAEVVAGTSDSGIYAFSGAGKRLWHLPTKLPGVAMRKAEMLWVRSLSIRDLDGDGRAEVVAGSRPHAMVTVVSGEGQPLWRKNFPDIMGRWSTALVQPLDLTGDGKPELACLFHGIVVKADKGTSPLLLLDRQGNILTASYPGVSLVSIGAADMDGNGRPDLMLSSPTRGRGFYRVAYPAGLAPLELARPKDDLDALVAAVAAMKPLPAPERPARPIQVLIPVKFREVEKRAVPLARYLRSLEAPGLEFALMITAVHEERGKLKDGYRPPASARKQKRLLFSREQIVATARYLESRQLPFYVEAAKIALPNMRAATCEAIMAAAPKYCRGFLVNENAPTRTSKFPQYVVWAEQVMDACHRHGDKKFIMDEFLNFWSSVPANPRWFAALFKPAYRDVAVPMYKTNRLVAPEQMQGMILGLWKAGVVAEWGYCTEDDAWKWGSWFMNPPHDVLMRLEVMAAALGATYFRIEENREFIRQRGADFVVEAGTPRHRGLFHELVRKGALRPAQDAAELIVSPVALRKDGDGLDLGQPFGHNEYWQRVHEGRGLWSCGTLLQAVRPDYPFASLYAMRHGYEGLFPQTPYGLVALLPAHLKANAPCIKATWTIGADSATAPGGRGVPRARLRDALLASFTAGAAELPVRADGCLTVIRRGQGGFRVYLFDPGHFDAGARQVSLRLARPEAVAAVTDLVSGEKLEIADKCVKLRVPAGGLRILEVRLKERALKS